MDFDMSRPTKGQLEKRSSFVTELRADSQGDEMSLVGYACSFGVLSQDLGGFREMIAPGAFSRSLAAGDDCHCLVNHDPSLILGRRKSGTLQVEEDSRGLKFRCALNPKSQAHRDIHAAIKRGDIDQCSFAFMADDGGDEWGPDVDENGQRFVKRTLRSVKLSDVSAVTYPAFNAPGSTTVSARSLPQYGHEEYFAYAQKRVKLLGTIIDMDNTTQRAWTAVDELNLAEAKRLGAIILADEQRLAKVLEDDEKLRRAMELAAGRLRK
jgi:uncharacterized protein